MTTRETPFTTTKQVDEYIKQCRDSGMVTRNHTFFVTTALMRKYFNSKDPVINEVTQENRMCVWCERGSNVHSIVIDYWDELDELEEAECLRELAQQNRQWGQDTGLLPGDPVDPPPTDDWQLVNDDNNQEESDITPLLGLRNRSGNIKS